MDTLLQSAIPVLQIIWIDLVLSGDNAVVIALACRDLPAKQKRMGMVLGAGVAIGLRILFALIVTQLMALPFLKIVGALLLFWIASKMLVEEEDEKDIPASDKLWQAVKTIAIADAAMSLDNVLALAAVARGDVGLLVFGLVVSIPLIIAGATLVMAMIARFPILVWAGSALLGWISGEMFVSDPFLVGQIGEELTKKLHYPAALLGAVVVVGIGYMLRRKQGHTPA
ncbi:TerC family protein [Rhizobiales bacterium TNE-4]|nr:TerC family protein [Rhizobiales bacterium TNE-4]MBV1828445.1 TerC family protein [Rhizobiales bacterium TNE-4]